MPRGSQASDILYGEFSRERPSVAWNWASRFTSDYVKFYSAKMHFELMQSLELPAADEIEKHAPFERVVEENGVNTGIELGCVTFIDGDPQGRTVLKTISAQQLLQLPYYDREVEQQLLNFLNHRCWPVYHFEYYEHGIPEELLNELRAQA